MAKRYISINEIQIRKTPLQPNITNFTIHAPKTRAYDESETPSIGNLIVIYSVSKNEKYAPFTDTAQVFIRLLLPLSPSPFSFLIKPSCRYQGNLPLIFEVILPSLWAYSNSPRLSPNSTSFSIPASLWSASYGRQWTPSLISVKLSR